MYVDMFLHDCDMKFDVRDSASGGYKVMEICKQGDRLLVYLTREQSREIGEKLIAEV